MTKVINAPELRVPALKQAEIDAVYQMLGERITRLTSQMMAALASGDLDGARHTLAHLETTQRIQNKMIVNLHLFPGA